MAVTRLSGRDGGATIETDLAIVGGGPVGLAIADRCARKGIDVLVLESGLEQQDEAHEAFNEVIAADWMQHPDLAARRTGFHGGQAPLWNAQRQAYGVRCRGLGGSTQAWAGKVAPFDDIDFAERNWVPDSGWPIGRKELDSSLDQARELLGLCPTSPAPRFSEAGLQSCYWQFARSRTDRLDVMRFGRDFAPGLPPKVRVLLDATVTRMGFDPASQTVDVLEVASLSGASLTVKPRHVVLAAGAIENPRLMLVSNDVEPGGIGNHHDLVGRYLIDHAGIRLGEVKGSKNIVQLARTFGFYGQSQAGRSHMFMHGLNLSPDLQEQRELLNAAIYFAPLRAVDDPFDALKRLLRGRSDAKFHDVAAVAKGMGYIARGIGTKMLASPSVPQWSKDLIVGSAIRFAPNMVADEFASGGLPHKLTGLGIEAITETAPDRGNRILLADKLDAFGIRCAAAQWRVGEIEARTIRTLATRLDRAFAAAGYAAPELVDWANDDDHPLPAPVDLAHMMGTTRMAKNPDRGVVDSNCRVFGTKNLYIAGGSVCPTGGHANPTWMFLALALRLADHLALEQNRCEATVRCKAPAFT
ncbi:GMC oxidoreductase [Sphingorhabdus sp.]|jgi:choline dehydrogenase-like flavoprotein|uniref:GMC oxidoreductase n=1 Tax=Sphingorhabdus sp. TaxID=1902408 RepID=UPI0035AEB137|nr:GMC family oxidoreductase [Sphingomonadaceae bacterium]